MHVHHFLMKNHSTGAPFEFYVAAEDLGPAIQFVQARYPDDMIVGIMVLEEAFYIAIDGDCLS